MLYLDSEVKKDIYLYINCAGGDVRYTLYIKFVFIYLETDILTLCLHVLDDYCFIK